MRVSASTTVLADHWPPRRSTRGGDAVSVIGSLRLSFPIMLSLSSRLEDAMYEDAPQTHEVRVELRCPECGGRLLCSGEQFESELAETIRLRLNPYRKMLHLEKPL